MSDQAYDLRQMVLRTLRTAALPAAEPPRLVVVTGGKGGVGTTTIAVNLAVALVREGRRTVLVDADFTGADAGNLCGTGEGATVADVLAGRRTVHEALERGPGGIQVLPGSWARGQYVDCSPSAQQRLIAQLQTLGAFADCVVIDAGNGANRTLGRFWQAADDVLIVTTAWPVSIMDAYAAIKLHGATAPTTSLHAVVNLAGDDTVAADVQQRLARACRRFLAREVNDSGWLPVDGNVAEAGAQGRPFLLEAPDCPASLSIEQLAATLKITAVAPTRAVVAVGV
jgi:flagellar biosynthesis protein FlhG